MSLDRGLFATEQQMSNLGNNSRLISESDWLKAQICKYSSVANGINESSALKI